MSKVAMTRVLLTAVLLAAIVVSSQQQRIDCRRFVFAPICRGVAAKRSEGGGAAMRFLHSVQPLRGGGKVVDMEDDSINVIKPSEEPSTDELQGPEIAAIERMRLLQQRALRDRKLRTRQQQQRRFYMPRPPGVTLQSEYEY